MLRAVAIEIAPLAADDARHLGLQSGVEGGGDAAVGIGSPKGCATGWCHAPLRTRSTKCGAANGGASRRRFSRSAKASAARGSAKAERAHAFEHTASTTRRPVRMLPRVEPRRLLRQRREKRRLRRRQHRRGHAEACLARPLRAGNLIPMQGQVEIEREDLASTGDAPAAARASGRRAWCRPSGPAPDDPRSASRARSSFTTCCVSVDPPSTTRPSARLVFIARASAIGSTPGCEGIDDPRQPAWHRRGFAGGASAVIISPA